MLFKSYQVLFEGNNYWCYVEVHEDYNTKVVGFLSIDADGPEGAVIVPAPCKSFNIEEDDKEILNQFLEKYKDADVLGARKADMLKDDLNKADLLYADIKWPNLELPTQKKNKL